MSDPKPWAKAITYGWAAIDCGWPFECGPRQLRGAVITALSAALQPGELEPWCQRDVAGNMLKQQPPVLYRVHRDGAGVFVIGPQTRDLLSALAYHLTALVLPNGEAVGVRSVRTSAFDGEVVHLGAGWARYRLRTPYFPCDAAVRRRPKDREWAEAWASQAVESSIREWAAAWGLEEKAKRPVHAVVSNLQARRCVWERPERGQRKEVDGFTCEIVTNVLVPPGVGIGARVSEGFGELDLLGVMRC